MQSALPLQLGGLHDLQELRRSLTGKIFLAVSATAFVALCAHVSLPLYFTPVPLTLQTFAVLLVGLTLGPALGFSALLLYLAQGAMGLPVFSPHGPGGVVQLLGPTAGFLLSFPAGSRSGRQPGPNRTSRPFTIPRRAAGRSRRQCPSVRDGRRLDSPPASPQSERRMAACHSALPARRDTQSLRRRGSLHHASPMALHLIPGPVLF